VDDPHRYTFGDSDLAAERLRLVAESFAPSSERFLTEIARDLGGTPRVAVDLGCGLGRTTRLLRGCLPAARVFGLDRSLAFLEIAKAEASDGVSFVEHDVTRSPLPVPPADLLYCRFLLTHLAEPVEVLRAWRQAVVPGGVLAVEELEHLSSPDPILAGYYAMLEAMQGSHGHDTFIGRRLEGLVREAGWAVRSSRVLSIDIGGRRMARLHLPNFQTWRRDPYVVDRFPPARIDEIERGLAGIVADDGAEPPVDYRLRQLVAVV
jgi:SAM-dependent methyltransferase